jgi:hypothetical protein
MDSMTLPEEYRREGYFLSFASGAYFLLQSGNVIHTWYDWEPKPTKQMIYAVIEAHRRYPESRLSVHPGDIEDILNDWTNKGIIY